MAARYTAFYAFSGEDPLGTWKGSSIGDGWAFVREQKEIPGRSQGCLTYAATGWGSGAGVASGWAAAGRGLMTPAMKRSANLIALSMERQG